MITHINYRSALVVPAIVWILLVFSPTRSQAQATDSFMLWGAGIQLAVKDFKHFVDSAAIKRGTPYMASSLLDIRMDVTPFTKHDTFCNYNIPAVFFRYLSWLYDTTQLRHEQLHFDISEVYARRMRRCLHHMKLDPDNYNFVKLKLNELYYDHAKYHVLYDKQTLSGKQINMQKLWEKNVATQLDTLKAYNEPTGSIDMLRGKKK